LKKYQYNLGLINLFWEDYPMNSIIDAILQSVTPKISAINFNCDFVTTLRTTLFELATQIITAIAEHNDIEDAQIEHDGKIWYNKGKSYETYHTELGIVKISRNTFQTSKGGATFVPMEHKLNLVNNSTQGFANMVSYLFALIPSAQVKRCMELMNLSCSRNYAQILATQVGEEVVASNYKYNLPDFPDEVQSISIGMDGAMIPIKDEGYREGMVGTISFYSKVDRMYTITVGAAPEHGKEVFLNIFQKEIDKVKGLYPDVVYQGIADAASSNWEFLDKNTDVQVLDFYHASEHVQDLAEIVVKEESDRKEWVHHHMHRIKHTNVAGLTELIDEVSSKLSKFKGKEKKKITTELNYLLNHREMMKYWTERHNKRPIGSGVTEGACKTLIKQRFGISGAKWSLYGVKTLIALRALILTKGRHKQFCSKAKIYGYRRRLYS
jgi:hypothetical protein